MTKFKFTSGTIEKISFDFYTLVLYNGEKVIYKATIGRLEAAGYIDKYDNIKIKYIG